MNNSTDRIEREVTLAAPVARVWSALANAEEFGDWFGADFKGQTFTAGQTVRGDKHGGCGHTDAPCELAIESIEPQRRLAMRWHPYAVDANVDYSGEPMTLIEFTLTDGNGGPRLRVVESGFDALPAARRDEAFPMHVSGWEAQLENITKYLAKA